MSVRRTDGNIIGTDQVHGLYSMTKWAKCSAHQILHTYTSIQPTRSYHLREGRNRISTSAQSLHRVVWCELCRRSEHIIWVWMCVMYAYKKKSDIIVVFKREESRVCNKKIIEMRIENKWWVRQTVFFSRTLTCQAKTRHSSHLKYHFINTKKIKRLRVRGEEWGTEREKKWKKNNWKEIDTSWACAHYLFHILCTVCLNVANTSQS